jgi:hypothetical protein
MLSFKFKDEFKFLGLVGKKVFDNYCGSGSETLAFS